MTQPTHRFTQLGGVPEPTPSNIPLLIIACAFLCVTIVLVLLQPGLDPNDPNGQVAIKETPRPILLAADIPTAAPAENPVEDNVVTRAQIPGSLLNVVRPRQRPDRTRFDNAAVSSGVASAEISDGLRQPIRLSSTNAPASDLNGLTRDVLANLGVPATDENEALRNLLIEAVLQKQSDLYIHALLNTAARQGAVAIPPMLRTTQDELDARTVLQAMVIAARGQSGTTLSVDPSGTHVVATGESLAGIGLMYFGTSVPGSAFLQSNPALDPNAPQLVPGSRIVLPAVQN